MALNNLRHPILYLITSGATTRESTAASLEFQAVLSLVRAGVEARVSLIQLREKSLPARVLYELTTCAVEITRGTETRLLVNDRADLARSAGADGCHLTTRSVSARVIRQTFGPDFLIGVSAHSEREAREARDDGADFAVFGPIFETPSKSAYGPPVGLKALSEVASGLSPFPLIALGGITLENVAQAMRAGAAGVAAIRLLSHPESLSATVETMRAEMKAEG